jgi:hypothetical protein
MTEKENQHSNSHISNFQVNIKERIHHGSWIADTLYQTLQYAYSNLILITQIDHSETKNILRVNDTPNQVAEINVGLNFAA